MLVYSQLCSTCCRAEAGRGLPAGSLEAEGGMDEHSGEWRLKAEGGEGVLLGLCQGAGAAGAVAGITAGNGVEIVQHFHKGPVGEGRLGVGGAGLGIGWLGTVGVG